MLSSVSSKVKYTISSLVVIADDTHLCSSSNTFSIRWCSFVCTTPASAPASTNAKISSWVINSSLEFGVLNTLKTKLATPLNINTIGVKIFIVKVIGFTKVSAIFSG